MLSCNIYNFIIYNFPIPSIKFQTRYTRHWINKNTSREWKILLFRESRTRNRKGWKWKVGMAYTWKERRERLVTTKLLGLHGSEDSYLRPERLYVPWPPKDNSSHVTAFRRKMRHIERNKTTKQILRGTPNHFFFTSHKPRVFFSFGTPLWVESKRVRWFLSTVVGSKLLLEFWSN